MLTAYRAILVNYLFRQFASIMWIIFSSLITFQESNSCLSFAMPGLVSSLFVLLVSCLWWQGLLWMGMRLQVGYMQEYVAF